MPRPGPNVTSDADTQPGSDSLFPTGFSGGGALVRSGSVGTGEIADGSVASADLNLASVATALAARGEFTGTYAPISGSLEYATLGLRGAVTPVVFAGDSLTTTTGYLAYAGAAALGAYPVGIAKGQALSPSDAGVSGNTSTQLLARFDTDVIAPAPKLVHILIGTNDTGQSVSLATYAANVKAMVAKCRAIGARIIIGTIPPNGTGSPANRKAQIVAFNQWLCRYAIAQRIPVADYYRALVDPSTGGYQSAYDSGDGTHPSAAGTGVMATELLAAMSRPLTSALLLTKDANDPWNFTRNALFLSAFGTGWSAPTLTGGTLSTVSGDANIQGNWGKLAAVATAGTFESSQNQTTTQGGAGFTAGNRMMFGARVQASALSSGQSFTLRVRTTDGTYDVRTQATTKVAYTGNGGLIFFAEGPAAPTVAAVQSDIQISSGTGDLQVAQFTAYDLTAMGVTDTLGNLI